VWESWLAGATRMHWRSFVIWNALGGIVWATAIGLLAYFLGNSASNAVQAFGIYGLVAVVLAAASAFVAHRRHRKRQELAGGQPPKPADVPPQPIEDPEA